MNKEKMAIFIVTMMMTIVMFASTATAQITVDGNGSDWEGLAGVQNVTDETYELWVTAPNCTAYELNWDSGYDLAEFAIYYNETTDTLYFGVTTTGTPGDADGDGDPNSCSDCTGDCCKASTDNYEVSPVESYTVLLYVAGSTYRVTYTNNTVSVTNADGTEDHTANFSTEHSIGSLPYTDTIVEVSICPAHNLTGFEYQYMYMIEARCGSADDYCSEDWVGGTIELPVPVAKARGIGCLEVELNASESYDPYQSITRYEWDIGCDGYYEVDGGTNPIHTHTYSGCGDRCVGLRVTNEAGINNSTTVVIYVDCPPTAQVTANRTDVPESGGWVFFDGSGSSDPEDYPLTFSWEINGAPAGTEENVTYYVTDETKATLTVTDEYGCEAKASVTVNLPKKEVPVLTLPGILALIGMLCIAGVGRIMRKRV